MKRSTAWLLLAALAAFLVAFDFGFRRQRPNEEPPAPQPPAYSVIDKSVKDVPGFTRVDLNVRVAGKFTANDLRALLLRLHRELDSSGPYQFRARPTNVQIGIYPSAAHWRCGFGQWLAILNRSGDKPPEVEISGSRIEALSRPSSERFGLSEPARRRIFVEASDEDLAAMKASEARTRVRFGQILSAREASEASMLAKVERDARQAVVAAKHQITPGQLADIVAEGWGSNWACSR